MTWNKRKEKVAIPDVDSMYTAVEAIVEVVKFHSETPIIIIDEFNQIESEKERKLFAVYLKSLGDRGVNIKFIITGVAQSLKQLLSDHGSGFRQLDTINLERLYWGPRETIVNEAIKIF